jgi:hypothetical protein
MTNRDFRFDGGPTDPPSPSYDAEKEIASLDAHFEEIVGDLDMIGLDHGIEVRDLLAECERLRKTINRRLRGE